MARIFIKPEGDRIVRHPEKISYIIPSEGEWVNDSTQWQRYIRHGDVTIAQPPEEVKKTTDDKPEKAKPIKGDEQ